jgi:acyl-CoA thioesterase
MSFSQVMRTLAATPAGFEITVGDDWLQGRATFGGLVAAAGNEAMRGLVPSERPLRSLQTTFVGPANPGKWKLQPRVLRVGKAVTIAHCEILSDDQVAATLVGIYGMSRESAVVVKPEAVASPRSIDEIREVQYKPEHNVAFLQHFAIRWAEGARPFTSTRSRSKVYIRHRDPAPLTESAIVALIDCIPTPAMSMFKAPAPSSSMVWTLELFEHDLDFASDRFWRIDTDLDAATDGYVTQTGVLNDPNGRPVAITRQLVVVFG